MEAETTVNERVKMLVDELVNGNQLKFAVEIGTPASTINSIIGSRQTKPGYDVLSSIHKRYDIVNLSWLLTGHGEVFTSGKQPSRSPVLLAEEKTHYGRARANIYYVPNPAQAGIYRGVFDAQYLTLPKLYIPGFESSDDAFLFHVEGESMYPFLSNGDMVVAVKINSIEEVKPGFAYVICTREMLVVKRIQRINEKNKILLVSDNSEVQEAYKLHVDDITNIFLVKGAISSNTSKRFVLGR